MSYAIQNSRDKKKLGKNAPWFAVWKDRDGKKHSLKVGKYLDAKEIATERERNAKRAASGLTFDKRWDEFRSEYVERGQLGMQSVRSKNSARQALDLFEKLIKPKFVDGINHSTLSSFAAKRRKMRGKKVGDTVAAATIRKELRTIRAALSFAQNEGYILNVPGPVKVAGFETEKRFVTVEHFGAILEQCQIAAFPINQGISSPDWWDALLSLLWVAPNRITAMLSLRWDYVDFERGRAAGTAR